MLGSLYAVGVVFSMGYSSFKNLDVQNTEKMMAPTIRTLQRLKFVNRTSCPGALSDLLIIF